MAKLVSCWSCSTYVLPGEPACPFCGAAPKTVGRVAGAVVLGLTMGACGGDDMGENADTFDTAAAYGVPATSSIGTDGMTTSETDTDASSGSSGSSESSGSSGSSGTSGSSGGETDTDTDTGGESETDTDTGGTTLEPDYGVPTTSG